MGTRARLACLILAGAAAAGALAYARRAAAPAQARRPDPELVFLSRGPVPAERLVDGLASPDPITVRDVLCVLDERRDPSGVAAAVPLLESRDPYVWINAALYLGSMGRREAVPYLIRGLRHRAWQAHGRCASHLTQITGEDFGSDPQKWRGWWRASNPSNPFDFDCYLGEEPDEAVATGPA